MSFKERCGKQARKFSHVVFLWAIQNTKAAVMRFCVSMVFSFFSAFEFFHSFPSVSIFVMSLVASYTREDH